MAEACRDLAALVDDLDERQFDELWDAAQSRKCFEKYGAKTIEGLLDKWGHVPICPDCGASPPRLDEMYFNDTDLLHDLGRKPRRGLSKDLICVVVAIDVFKNVLVVVSENGKPSAKRINAALEAHIKPDSTVVHDCEKAHNSLVKKLKLVDERYKANTADSVYLMQMALVNNLCSWIRRYVGRFSCMRSANLQSYLNWFVYLFRVHRDEEKWPVEERVVRHLALSNSTYLRKW